MLDCTAHRAELDDRMMSIRNLLDATHNTAHSPDASREARGLAIVLLYASYEHLLVSVCQSVLEKAGSLRVGNRRLRPGLQLFAAFPKLQAVQAGGSGSIWRGSGMEIVNTIIDRRGCSISPAVFPDDGSHMRRSQVTTVCNLLDFDPPAPILREVWERIDTIVSERNAVAHGRRTADEIGRNYTLLELTTLVDLWELRWKDFLAAAEARASTREFYRLAR
jgi:hypothetical protein